MFSRHCRDFDCWDFLYLLLRSRTNIYHHSLKGVKFVDGSESFIISLVSEMSLSVWGCDDGKRTTKRGLDLLIKMITIKSVFDVQKMGFPISPNPRMPKIIADSETSESGFWIIFHNIQL